MQLNNTANTVTSIGAEQSIQFDIDDSNKGFVFEILRSKIYSDPVLATVRELISNAKDAHTDAGCPERPIRVYLPDKENSVFEVQDWGKGMPPELIHKVYKNYGSSLKGADNNQIGGFGLGSKAPFSLVDSFTIRTIHGGVKYLYSAYIDETRVGTISLLMSEPTTEPTGTTIQVPVHRDQHEFERKLQLLTEYWSVKPECNKPLSYCDQSVVVQGDGWQLLKPNRNSSVLLIGEIPYRVSAYQVYENNYDAMEKMPARLLDVPVIINIPIGSVDLAVSRESIQYTERSRNSIHQILNRVWNEMEVALQEELSKKANLQEACQFLFEDVPSNITGKNSFLFRNEPLAYAHPFAGEFSVYNKIKGNFTKARNILIDKFEAYSRDYKIPAFLINDTGKQRLPGMTELLEGTGASRVYWIPLPEGKTYEEFLEENPILKPENLNATRVSEIYTPPKRVRNSSTSTQEKGKIQAYKLPVDYYVSNGSFYKVAVKERVDLEGTGIYVVLVGKETSSGMAPGLVNRETPHLSHLKILNQPIYGIQRTHVEKLGSGWVHLNTAVNGHVEGKLADSAAKAGFGDVRDFIAYCQRLELQQTELENQLSDCYHKLNLLKRLHSVQKAGSPNSTFVQFMDKVLQLKSELNQHKEAIWLSSWYSFETPVTLDDKSLSKEWEAVEEVYPLLALVISRSGFNSIREVDIHHYLSACNHFQLLQLGKAP